VDNPLVVKYKLYANTRLVFEKVLDAINGATTLTRDTFSVDKLEYAYNDGIKELLGDDPEYDIEKRSYAVRAINGRSNLERMDMRDFSIEEIEKVLKVADAISRTFPTSDLRAVFKFKITYNVKALTIKRKKIAEATTAATAAAKESKEEDRPIPSKRTDKLLEQHSVKLEALREAGEFQSQLMRYWKCYDDSCLNKDNYCFVDAASSPPLHYALKPPHMESWSNAVAKSTAIIT